jgi:hypothetical protein
MAGTIYNSSYPNGITLSNPATQNPATIGSSSTISNSGTTNGSHAIYGELGTAWTIFNHGDVAGFSTTTAAIYLESGGSLTNGSSSDRSAEVLGAKTAVTVNRAIGTIINFGTLLSTGAAGGGVNLADGGTITNEAEGLILSSHTGVIAGRAATVNNFGTIQSSSTSTGSGAGVYFAAGGRVSNQSSGVVFSYNSAIDVLGAAASVSNYGTISNSGKAAAINLAAGGTVTNGKSGVPAQVLSSSTAVDITGSAGTVTNFGSLISAPTAAAGGAVYLGAGGSVVNKKGALIQSSHTGIRDTGKSVTIVNYGTIASLTTASSGAGIYLGAGGAVTNAATGYVSGGRQSAIVAQNTAVTLVNSGKIASTGSLAAAYFGAYGHVTNAGTIVLSLAGAALELKTAGTVVNTGLLDAPSGTGLLIGSAAVATSATVSVTNSALISGLVGAAVSGLDTGKSTIVNDGTITGANGVAVSFGGGADTLVIEPKSVLNGTVANFAPGDTIDFAHESGSSTTFSNGVLSLVSGGAAIATVDLSGAFGAADFSVKSDSAGGTDVTVSAAALPNDLTGNGVSDALMTDTNNGVLVVGELSKGAMAYTPIGGLGTEWQFAGTGPLLGDGRDGFLVWAGNASDPDYGALVVGEDVGGTATYTQIGSIGPEWQFEGVGPLEGGANADFLLWDGDSADANYGALVVGAVNDLSAVYTQIGSIGPEWQFEGVANYLGNSSSQFLLWDTSTSSPSYGALVVGQDVNGTAQYTAVGGLVPTAWAFEGTGDLLNDGRSSFLLWNSTSGALDVGEVNGGAVQYTQIGAVGSEWQFLGVGDYDGASPAEFLMRDSTNGVLALGTVASGQASYVAVGGVGPEWNFHNSPPALIA